jgi:hypothetical protein
VDAIACSVGIIASRRSARGDLAGRGGSWIGSSNSRTQPRSLMTLAPLVDPPIWHPRRVLGVALIAPRAGCTSSPAVAGVLAFPRLMGMVLAHPAAVLAEATFHQGRVDKMHQQNPWCGRAVPDIKS